MAKALQPAVSVREVFFELDRFELGDSGRLDLSGRWFGVRGRRFVRPTLLVQAEEGQFRALADLEHKPWAAEDGEFWEAAFSWNRDAEILEAELAVASGIAIQLPAPGTDPASPRRLPAAPDPVVADAAKSVVAKDAEPAVKMDPEPPAPLPQNPRRARPIAESERLQRALDGAREERDAVRSELGTARTELDALRTELEALRAQSTEAAEAAETAKREAAAAVARRDAAVGSAEEARAALDAALLASDEMAAMQDRQRSLRDRLSAERDEARAEVQRLESELNDARTGLQRAVEEHRATGEPREQAVAEHAAGERDQLLQGGQQHATDFDDAAAARGAALVMRNAAHANPAFESHAGWVRRALAIGVLVLVGFALLTVLHLL